MGFTTERHGDTVVIGVAGQLVAGNRQELRHTVLDEIERGERRFRIDFSHASFIDSSGLGILVSLSKKIREQGGELVSRTAWRHAYSTHPMQQGRSVARSRQSPTCIDALHDRRAFSRWRSATGL